MYYIYHIPGIKIGCTNDLEKRMKDQGFTEWQILEQHEDGWVAGNREIELQKEYGYPVDKSHYMISRQNRKPSYEDSAKGGKTQGIINTLNGHIKKIQKENASLGAAATNSIIKKCLECDFTSTPAGVASHMRHKHKKGTR